MTKQLTFADIEVGKFFYMDMGGQSDVLFEKIGTDTCKTKKLNQPGYLTMQGRPLWEVKSEEQMMEELSRRHRRAQYIPVPGHSSTYPYGEH